MGVRFGCLGGCVRCTARALTGDHFGGKTMLAHRVAAGAAVAVLVAAVVVGMAAPGVAESVPRGMASPVAALTGIQSINETEARYDVKGTDLGIMWTDERGQILIAFGDTFGAGWNNLGSGSADPAAADARTQHAALSTRHQYRTRIRPKHPPRTLRTRWRCQLQASDPRSLRRTRPRHLIERHSGQP